ncbi:MULTISPECIES: prolipoprotein diacylglyceryl transferase [Microbacterium]|jgi:prolipoprotein diacylglyceryl transferase|uniref:prolipoprotein diacylglyceryl transferase n=1 Tax=Microbacterium TaxID=33882 RepID=UPI0010F9C25F|nr:MULTISPECIES: prolipoprotein diacylglyceryl transferase [unclassified Microbacterium]MBN9152382.1 prolipoprotein diacylglyceryl transferase [Microbacterium sp.]MCK9913885.1 prolipoprotein diacylglyceryl transferase [Microbacteriaceae bacterium K1510]
MIATGLVPALIPSPEVSFLQIGPLQIRFYAMFILAGIGLAVAITARRLRAAGHAPGTVVDVAMWAVPLGILGARAYHVLTHPRDYFFPGADLLRVLYIWEGGIAIFGATLFGLLGIVIGTRRAGIPVLQFLDALAPGMLVAQAVGRIGNYFNQELFGPPTMLPWGLQIDPGSAAIPPGTPAGTLFQPLFLYELIWNLLGALMIIVVERTRTLDGRIRTGSGRSLGLYLLWYGVGRAFLESIRLDPTELLAGGVKANLATAVAAAAFGVALIVRAELRARRAVVGTAAEVEAVHADSE